MQLRSLVGPWALVMAAGCSGDSFSGGSAQNAQQDAGAAETGTTGAGGSGKAGSGGMLGSAAGTTSAGGSSAGGTSGGNGGSVGGGSASGAGGSCSPQACANDSATCGEVPDGCGGVSKCLHECGAAEACGTDHRCACDAVDRCPATLNGIALINPCCTTTLACGQDLNGCNPIGKCTFVPQHGGCGIAPTGGSVPSWICPGLDVGPDPSCTRMLPPNGQPYETYFCCDKNAYP